MPKRKEQGSPTQEPTQERVIPTLNPWAETNKAESSARETAAKAFISEKPEQAETYRQEIIDTIIAWRSREDNFFDQELERMTRDVLDKYIANGKVMHPESLMYRLGLIVARGQVMLNTKVQPPSVETTFQEDPDKKAVLEQAVNNFISAVKFEDELQNTTDQEKLQSLYSRLLEHTLSDHVVDQLAYQIKRSNVMPTSEQSQKVLRWLEQKTQEPEQKLRSDADRMGYAEYHAEDGKHGQLARKVYQHQLDTFSNLTGIKATTEGHAEARKRFSEWKKGGQEDTLVHIMDDLLGERSVNVDTDYKLTRIYKILSSPDQYANILWSNKDIEYLKTLVPFLEQIKDLEEQMKKDLAYTQLVSKGHRERIFKDANGQIAQVYKRMKTAINAINADRDNWLKKQLEQGNLRVWSEGEIKKLKARSPQEAGEMSDLGQAAIEKAVKERNAGLYGLTDEERALDGQEWEDMVKEKRAHAVKQIEAKLLAMVGLKKKEKFSNMFKGLFQGKNELSFEKGKTTDNKEFLRDIFADREFISQLMFEYDRGFSGNFLGRQVLSELASLSKELNPKEGEDTAGNGVDRVLMARIEEDLERDTKAPLNAETLHFRMYKNQLHALGIDMAYDELATTKESDNLKNNLEKIDIAAILESGQAPNLLPELINLYRKYFDEQYTKEKFIDAITQSLGEPVAPSGIKDALSMFASPELRKSNFKTGVTILEQEGLADFDDFRDKLKEIQTAQEDPPEFILAMQEAIYSTPECDTAVDHGLALQKIAEQKGISVEELLAKLAA